MAEPLVRRDIWKLETSEDPWDPVTLAYALAVRAMQSPDRPPSDPTSWVYQAAVHAVRGATEPPDEFLHQCQHNTWFFLPWHRIYLLWFERIIRSIVKDLDEIPADVRESWALPYWNYEGGQGTAALPPAFRERELPDGSANPLFVNERNEEMNEGQELPSLSITAGLAMAETEFAEEPRARALSGFGGWETDWHHGDEGLGIPGELEVTPHGSVHSDVGGFMGGFATAGLDPLFWLHHCNIDRLWEVWIGQGDRSNPTKARWTNWEFNFHDETGAPVKGTPGSVVDTVDVGYTYDDVTPPPAPRRRRRRMADAARPRSSQPPDMVGATDDAVELTGQPASVEFSVEPPPGLDASRRRRGEREAPQARVYLKVENVEGERNPGRSYGVFVTPPGDDEDATEEDYHVGNLSLFGIEEASNLDQDHPGGHGLGYAFDITDLVEDLEAEGRWDPERIKVTFAPNRPAADDEAVPPVRVGRVSLYFQ
jgi:tyrosinase